MGIPEYESSTKYTTTSKARLASLALRVDCVLTTHRLRDTGIPPWFGCLSDPPPMVSKRL